MTETSRLEVGDKAPAFSLPDADGNTVKLSDFKGTQSGRVLLPAASTPGCTKQACEFRDSLASLDDAGIDVVGISPDKPDKFAAFRDAESLTFPLLSDPDKKVLTGGCLRREEALWKDGAGRYQVDVRRRRNRHDRGSSIQRESGEHRVVHRQEGPERLGEDLPNLASRRASVVAARSSTPRCRLSLML